MKVRRSRPEASSSEPAEEARLGGVKPLAVDDQDDRPSREDMQHQGHPMRIPVPLPRVFFPKSKRRRSG